LGVRGTQFLARIKRLFYLAIAGFFPMARCVGVCF